jgi:fused signal recognition particle receptor
MSGTAIVLVVIGIFLLAALLIAVPRALARRDAGPEPELRERPAPPTRPSARPPAPPPPAVTPVPTEEEVGEVLEEAERLLEAPPIEAPTEAPPTEEAVEELEVVEAPRLRDRLSRMRAAFSGLRHGGDLTDESWDELEETLLLADAGMATTQRILEGVRARASAGKVRDASALPELLREELVAQLDGDGEAATRRELRVESGEPNVWMFVGVNGVGKTTTVAKIARREQAEGHRVLLAAADTFRAAAAEQLGTWAERLGVELVRGQEGADPGSVVFDAMDAATSRGADLVLVDTAGRLHTKVNLMEELKKLRRIVDRRPGALREVLLVLDATTGQNGLTQAREFTDAVEVTGVVLTKLDGTAKGGVVLAIEHELGVPVKLVGVGEGADDLIPFDPDEFAAALVS